LAGIASLVVAFEHTMTTARYACCLLWCAAAVLVGCAHWNTDVSEPPGLPPTKMSSDTVVLEIAFVRLSGESLAAQDELWRQVDEQPLAADVRRRMNENGLRAGIVGSQLPPLLRKLLEEKADPLAIAGADLATDQTTTLRRLDCRAGKRGVILAGRPREKLTLLLHEEGRVRGETFGGAQCLFSITTFPQGDGRVRVELVPEIEHGAERQQWVARDGAIRVEPGKNRRILDSLKMDLQLSPGDVLVATCTSEGKGLGKQFFADASPGEQKVLLIRLAQTQYDDLFAPEKVSTPLVTPAPQ
jgi:hypothetical protein